MLQIENESVRFGIGPDGRGFVPGDALPPQSVAVLVYRPQATLRMGVPR